MDGSILCFQPLPRWEILDFGVVRPTLPSGRWWAHLLIPIIWLGCILGRLFRSNFSFWCKSFKHQRFHCSSINPCWWLITLIYKWGSLFPISLCLFSVWSDLVLWSLSAFFFLCLELWFLLKFLLVLNNLVSTLTRSWEKEDADKARNIAVVGSLTLCT